MKRTLWGALALLLTCGAAEAYNVNVTGNPTQKSVGSTKAATDLGAAVFGVRNDTNATLGTGDNQYVPLTTDPTGRLRVDATITPSPEVATAADGAAAPALGKMVMGLDGSGNGQYLSVDASGRLQVVNSGEAATGADASAGLPALLKVIGGYDGTNVRALKTSAAGAAQVDVLSSALPSGAATSANQTTANTSLSSIDGKLPALSGGRVPVDVQASVLPTGAATAANQSTANTSLSSIDTTTSALSAKFGSLGQKTMAGSAPVVIASDQSAVPASQSGTWSVRLQDGSGSAVNKGSATSANSLPVVIASDQGAVQTKAPLNAGGSGSAAAATVSTVITLSKPANAVGFVLMNLDTSTANVRWALGRTATATLGQQLQPGRDTGYIPASVDVSLVAESGTQNYDIQWITQ